MSERVPVPTAIIEAMVTEGDEQEQEPELIDVDNDNEDSIVPYVLREGSQ